MSGAHPESSGTGRRQRAAVVGTKAIRHYYRPSMKPTDLQPLQRQALLLEGGNEFRGAMEEADRAALRAAGPGPVLIVPAAAAAEGGQTQAGRNGVRWFEGLGAIDVRSTGWVDGNSQEAAEVAASVAASRLIFLTGGSPRYLADALRNSPVWHAVLSALEAGGVLAGSSAGAMVLCEVYYDPSAARLQPGLSLVPGVCILPHHDTFGRGWAPHIARLAKRILPVGIDEGTGMMNDGPDGLWTVYGKGAVTLHGPGGEAIYRSGERFELAGL
jgi:cyanophycinase